MEDEYIYQGRIAICEPRSAGNGQFNQNSFSGVLISPADMPKISETGDWENIQCEIIIRPLKRLGTAKIKGMRLDMAAMALSDDKQWETDK